MNAHPELADSISVSLHCELADILTAYTKLVERDASLTGLRAYSAARPPHSEGLAIWIASYLAYETECLNINLLHLSSRKAIEAALMMQDVFPHIRFKREVTVGHLLLDVDSECAVHAKVNPPIRPARGRRGAVAGGARPESRLDRAAITRAARPKRSGRPPIRATSGSRRPASAAPSTCSRASFPKGRSAACPLRTWPSSSAGIRRSATGSGARATSRVGFDADFVLVDPAESFVVRAADSPSQQGYTPFEGQELTGRVKSTYLRGEQVYDGSNIVGGARGRYLHRPTA